MLSIPQQWRPGLGIVGAMVALILGLILGHRDKPGCPHQHDVSWATISKTTPSWSKESQWPMLVAATIFVIQLAGSIIGLFALTANANLADNWTPRFRRSLRAHFIIAAMGSISYIRDFVSTDHIIASRPGLGQHLIMRNVNWLIGTPLQWIIFGQVCTPLTVYQMMPIFAVCFGLQFFGITMHFAPSVSLFYISFALSCGCFWWMFHLVFRLPLVKEMQVSAHRTRQVCFIVWTIYPVLNVLRWLDFIGDWTEQVLCLSMLDAFAKMFTFSSIILSRATLSLSFYNGALQLLLASHDLVLVVDEKFRLLDCPQPLPIITHYFGTAPRRQSLERLCTRRSDFKRLEEVAALADSQPLGSPSPQCNVEFCGHSKGFLAACFVSKFINGRRVISMNMETDHASPMATQMRLDYDENALLVRKSNLPGDLHMQLEIALHHCSEFMSLSQEQHDLLKATFTDTDTSCVLCVWDVSEDTQGTLNMDIVTASCRAHMIHLATKELPQPLTNIIRQADLQAMCDAMNRGKPIALQQAGTQLETGNEATVTVFPLRYGSSPIFLVMHFELAESVSSRVSHVSEKDSQTTSYWYNVHVDEGNQGALLMRTHSETADLIGPPTYLCVPHERSQEVWAVFFKLPVRGHPVRLPGQPSVDLLAFAHRTRLKSHKTILRFDEVFGDISAEDARKLLVRHSFKSSVDYLVPLPSTCAPIVNAFGEMA